MRSLLDLAKAVELAEVRETTGDDIIKGHSILIYGPPKGGKTALAASAAMSTKVDRVFFFDNENSWEVMLWMLAHGKLTEEAAAKIIIINIVDDKTAPYAMDTMMKVAYSTKSPIYINVHTGKVLPSKPKELEDHILEFQYSACTPRDVIVCDSLSQLGDSAMAAACLGQPDFYKPGWDEYGLQGKWLGDFFSVVQKARYCNWICCTHEVLLPDQDGKEKFFPLCGSKNFCYKVAKYFGTVCSVSTRLRKHEAGSSSTYSDLKLTGSRRGVVLEGMTSPSLIALFDGDTIKKQEGGGPVDTGVKKGVGGSLLSKK